MLEEAFLKQDKERYLYEMREKALLDHILAIGSAKADGKADVAMKMLIHGMRVEDLAEMTGLSVADIAKLRH